MINVMVDLETLGTGPNSVIISIGAIEFDTENQQLGRVFHRVINSQSCVDIGLEIGANTVIWWMSQSEEARSVFKNKGEDIKTVLKEFSDWYPKNAPIWGNGATFDNVLLSNVYRKSKIQQPWSYSKDRCYRTLKALMPKETQEYTGVAHNALDDARNQAVHAMKLMYLINAI